MQDELNYYLIPTAQFQTIVDNLKHLHTIVPKIYSQYSESQKAEVKKKTLTNLSFDQIKEIEKIVQSASKKNLIDLVNDLSNVTKPTLDSLSDMLQVMGGERTLESFLRKMIIVYIITEFEEFLKKTFSLIFINKPESLISGRQISHKEIFELNSYEKIIEVIITKNSKEFIDQNPEQLGNTLSKYFDIKEDDLLLKNIKEIFYRRHNLVHNNGIVDDEYREKTGLKNIENIIPTKEYVDDSLNSFIQFTTLISKKATEKFPQNGKRLKRFNMPIKMG